MNKNFIPAIKSKIIKELENRIGGRYNIYDLGWELTIKENNSSWFAESKNPRKESLDSLSRNIEEYASFCDYAALNYGDNPYLSNEDEKHSPEVVITQMMISAVECMFNSVVDFPDDENDRIEITEDFIDKIKRKLNTISSVKDIGW